MAILLIPVALDTPYSTQKTRLEGRDYNLVFRYNEREERFYLDIYDDERLPIELGFKAVTGWPLLQQRRWNTRLPPGELVFMALTEDKSSPTLNELGEGRRVELTYFESETA